MISRKASYIINLLKDYKFQHNKLYDRSLLGHLVSTYRLLKHWQNNDNIALIGLCHSIYEQCEGYPNKGLPIACRNEVAKIITHDIERLAYCFSLAEYDHSIINNCNQCNLFVQDSRSNDVYFINKSELAVLMEVSAANMVEQIKYLKHLITTQELEVFLTPYLKAKSLLSNYAIQSIDSLLKSK